MNGNELKKPEEPEPEAPKVEEKPAEEEKPEPEAPKVEEKPAEEEKPEPEAPKAEEKIINAVDAAKATRSATKYLEGIYGNLNLLLFRIEDVRQNGDKTKYLVLCSLLTNVGGPRRYYFIKVNITDGSLIKLSKGFRNQETGEIEWKEDNLPPGEG